MTVSEPGSAARSLESRVGAIVRLLTRPRAVGLAAELRRMRPGDVGCAAFWKIRMSHLEDGLNGSEEHMAGLERRWGIILSVLASMADLHRPKLPFGAALADAGVSECRVLKLLHARGDALADAVRAVCHQLAAARQHADLTDMARLVLSEGRNDEETARRRIARAYYRSNGETP
jgi:CRISPR type I-E-associated protein CasB/Cse2